MRCIVTSFGSAGDFLPTLAVGARLRGRGHDVTCVANPSYAERVRNTGLAFVAAGAHLDVSEHVERHRGHLSSAHIDALLQDLVAPNTLATHAVLRQLLASHRPDVVVAGDAAFGGLWAAKEAGVPSVLVTASPVAWMSWRAPALMGDGTIASALRRPLTLATSAFVTWYMSRFLRRLARRVGASLDDVSLHGTQRMAALNLGMWSPALRGPAASDAPNTRICGYARASALGAPTSEESTPAVDAFLAGGPPPVVVGLGSAYALTARRELQAIAGACARRALRCLVVGHPADVDFPPGTLAVRYAAYDRVFPRAAAVVVHGGAGTTGEALRCGRPVVGVPFAFDQFTLCALVERLGVGVRIPLRRRDEDDFAVALGRAVADAALAQRATQTAARFAAERDGAETAADAIERLVMSRPGVPAVSTTPISAPA